MKTIDLLLAILLLGLASCQKNELTPNDPDPVSPVIELGKVFVKRDGQVWDRPFIARRFDHYHPTVFSIISKVNNNGLEENFYLNDIPIVPGFYPMERGNNFTWGNLKPQANIGWWIVDQVLGGIFTDTTHANNFVEMIRYDSVNQTVEGRFEVHLGDFWPSPNTWGLPDSMHLTEGKFYLKLEE